IRAARRMAAGLHAKWIAVYVQTPRHLRLPESERVGVMSTLALAEDLGAETATLSGANVSQELLDYARAGHVTKISVGKPIRARWKEWVFGSVVADLVRNSGEIDVYVITGEAGEGRQLVRGVLQRTSHWPAYGAGAAVVAACSSVAWLMFPHFEVTN